MNWHVLVVTLDLKENDRLDTDENECTGAVSTSASFFYM